MFAENEEFSKFELVVYYVEHAFTSFLGTLILSISGRFDPLEYVKFPLPVCGFHLFCMYMRYFLSPLAMIFWANLNHTLCGVDNDPWYVYFEMGKWYLLFSDFYLLGSCYLGIIVNFIICYIAKHWILCRTNKMKTQ